MRIFLSTVLLVMVTAGVLRATEDTVIHLEGHSLVGLPREFQPASFKAEDGTLTVSGKTLRFSRFLAEIVADSKGYKLEFSASWYHDTAGLPPYLLLRSTPKGADFAYRILVDIKAARILEVEVELKESKTLTRFVPVDPAAWREDKGGTTVITAPRGKPARSTNP